LRLSLSLLTAAVATAALAVPVAGAAPAKPSLTPSVSRLNCGDQAVDAGVKACGPVTFTNTTSQGIFVGGTGWEEPYVDFYESGSTCTSAITLAPGQSCTIDVTFNPTDTGRRSAKLMLSDGTLGTKTSVRLVGFGTA
jgi:hypothetical protein